MRIGIVTDIHDEVDYLAAALAQLRTERADVIVSLGDTTDFHGTHNRAWDVAKMLRDANALGVWGNHDVGLCRDVPLGILENPYHDALAYFATFRGRISLADCHFTHVEPWIDSEDALALWYFDAPPVVTDSLARSFVAVPESQMFIGHFHRWLVGTPSGPMDWKGERALTFEPDIRYLMVVAPLMNGWFALFDTDSRTLIPYRLP